MDGTRKENEKALRNRAIKVLEAEYKDKMYRRNLKVGSRGGKEEMFEIVNFEHKIVGECLYLKATKSGKLRDSWETKILAKLFKLFIVSKDYKRILFIPKNDKKIKEKIISRYSHFMKDNTEIREV